jgi:hypothetical protein
MIEDWPPNCTDEYSSGLMDPEYLPYNPLQRLPDAVRTLEYPWLLFIVFNFIEGLTLYFISVRQSRS